MPELELAFDDPDELLARFAQSLGSRGIVAKVGDLPWVRLVDALCEERRCADIDWRADPEEVGAALAQLGAADKKLGACSHARS